MRLRRRGCVGEKSRLWRRSAWTATGCSAGAAWRRMLGPKGCRRRLIGLRWLWRRWLSRFSTSRRAVRWCPVACSLVARYRGAALRLPRVCLRSCCVIHRGLRLTRCAHHETHRYRLVTRWRPRVTQQRRCAARWCPRVIHRVRRGMHRHSSATPRVERPRLGVRRRRARAMTRLGTTERGMARLRRRVTRLRLLGSLLGRSRLEAGLHWCVIHPRPRLGHRRWRGTRGSLRQPCHRASATRPNPGAMRRRAHVNRACPRLMHRNWRREARQTPCGRGAWRRGRERLAVSAWNGDRQRPTRPPKGGPKVGRHRCWMVRRPDRHRVRSRRTTCWRW